MRGLLFVLKERHGGNLGYHNHVKLITSDQLSRRHESIGMKLGGTMNRVGCEAWGLDPALGNGDRHAGDFIANFICTPQPHHSLSSA
jgi:hypothetical protein